MKTLQKITVCKAKHDQSIPDNNNKLKKKFPLFYRLKINSDKAIEFSRYLLKIKLFLSRNGAACVASY